VAAPIVDSLSLSCQSSIARTFGQYCSKDKRPLCGAKCGDGHPCQARATLDNRNDRVRDEVSCLDSIGDAMRQVLVVLEGKRGESRLD